jgi:hypothetical protein
MAASGHSGRKQHLPHHPFAAMPVATPSCSRKLDFWCGPQRQLPSRTTTPASCGKSYASCVCQQVLPGHTMAADARSVDVMTKAAPIAALESILLTWLQTRMRDQSDGQLRCGANQDGHKSLFQEGQARAAGGPSRKNRSSAAVSGSSIRCPGRAAAKDRNWWAA